jgi:hypothetical protein
MKKALVVFLILAVAGGLFAEVTFGGHAQTGIGFGWDDTDADGTLGLIRSRGETGLRIGFTLSGKLATENYGTFSGSLGLRHSVDRFGGADSSGYSLVYFEDPRLTWAAGGPLGLTLGIGTGGPGGTGTPGPCDTNLDAGGGNGLAVQLKPVAVPALTVAVSAIFGRPQATIDQVAYAAGVKYSAADLLDVMANFKFDQTKDDKEKLNAAFGVSILPIVKALGFTSLAFDAVTGNGLGAPKSNITIGEKFGFKTGDLSLDLAAKQMIWTGTDDAPGYIPMRFQLGVGYKVSDLVTVGIDGRYLIGNKPVFNYRDAGNINDVAFVGDKAAGLGVSPYATFSLGGPSIQLGYNLQKDMSDPAPASGTRSMQHLVYGTFNVSF